MQGVIIERNQAELAVGGGVGWWLIDFWALPNKVASEFSLQGPGLRVSRWASFGEGNFCDCRPPPEC